MSEATELPDSFSAGETVTYTRSDPDYPATAGWERILYLAGKCRGRFVAVAQGSAYAFTLPAVDTAGLDPGGYQWVERVTKDGEAHNRNSGRVKVTQDLATLSDGEGQDWWEKTLEIIEAKLQGRLTRDQESWQILGEAVQNITTENLFKYRAICERKIAAAGAEETGRFGRSVLATFVKPGNEQ
jgi:hypothetical protein